MKDLSQAPKINSLHAHRIFRVFISSTFEDLKEERNRLHRTVFPRLQTFCRERGASFQAIDLRWGVSEEASLDQQTMKICLEEIARCHEVTPRPNFLVLLGQRYGWCPLPAEIPDEECRQILSVITDPADERLLVRHEGGDTGWYRLDKNAVHPVWVLQPRIGEHRDAGKWRQIEARLRRILQQAAAKLAFSDEQKIKYFASATEQEIRAGALQVPDAEGKVFSFFREIEGVRDVDGRLLEGAAVYVDQTEDSIRALKAKLTAAYEYTTAWDREAKRPDIAHLDGLADRAEMALQRAIQLELDEPTEAAGEAEIRRVAADEELDTEGRAHCHLANDLLRFFVGREQPRRSVSEYLAQERKHLLVLSAAGGGGKSALVAKLLEEAMATHLGAEIIYRFIGATPGSSDGRALLDSLCRELGRRYGTDEAAPAEYRDLVQEFDKRLRLASAEHPLLLLIDALDQLLERHGARSLSWLPNELPEHVWLVVSTRPDESLCRSLRPKQPVFVDVGPLSRSDGEQLLGQWLAAADRRLQPAQTEEVLAKFEQTKGLPLYLKLAFEEARHWTSWEPPEDLAPGISVDAETGRPGIIRKNLLHRLAHEDNHGSHLVACALGYLAASRHGLAEDELSDILSRDPELYASFFRGAFHVPLDLVIQAENYLRQRQGGLPRADDWLSQLHEDPSREGDLLAFLAAVLTKPDGPRLPAVLWSRLSFDLAPYLTERLAGGVNVLAFYHRELQDSATEEYLQGDDSRTRHRRLASYFRAKSDPAADRSWTGRYPRGLAELPYHLTEAQDWQEAYETLTNVPFLERKASDVGGIETTGADGEISKLYTGVLQLQDDYDHILTRIRGGKTARRARQRIILTPVDFGDGYAIRCPFCNIPVPFQEEWLGQEMPCPETACHGPWKVNPFVCKRPSWTESLHHSPSGAVEQAIRARIKNNRGKA